MGVTPLAPEASASANFATCAWITHDKSINPRHASDNLGAGKNPGAETIRRAGVLSWQAAVRSGG